ncbi:MAG: PfkB family carbohydrate kinase [Bacteroidota bacterium]
MLPLTFSHLHFLVAGDVMLDEYVFGDAERLSPEAPVPVLHVRKHAWSLGGAGNVALNLAKLGAQVTLLGLRGEDKAGEKLEQLLSDYRIHSALIPVPGKPTICKTRFIAGKHQLLRADLEDTFSEQPHFWETAQTLCAKNQYQAMLISDYGKGFCSEMVCQTLLQTARHQEKPVFVDPKGVDWDKYEGAFVVTPNFKEFEQVVGKKITNRHMDVETHIRTIRNRFSFQNLLITRSEQGMSLLHGERLTHFPAKALDVFDVTGAGDTVMSVLAALFLLENDLEQACHAANLAAGLVVSKFGAYAISREELEELLEADLSPLLTPSQQAGFEENILKIYFPQTRLAQKDQITRA